MVEAEFLQLNADLNSYQGAVEDAQKESADQNKEKHKELVEAYDNIIAEQHED